MLRYIGPILFLVCWTILCINFWQSDDRDKRICESTGGYWAGAQCLVIENNEIVELDIKDKR